MRCMQTHSDLILSAIALITVESPEKTGFPLTPLSTGHILLDIDGFVSGNTSI
jgi:hypothetical protein